MWAPLAWDRAGELVAAAVTGGGGFMVFYETIHLGEPNGSACDPETPCPYAIRNTPWRSPPEAPVLALMASSDARYVALSGPDGETWWWPLAKPEMRSRVETDARGIPAARWRPGTSEIWWVGGAGTELVSFDVTTGTRSVKLRGTYGPHLLGFRVDGSAAITGQYTPETVPGSRRTEATVVDLDDGRTETLSDSWTLWLFVRLR